MPEGALISQNGLHGLDAAGSRLPGRGTAQADS